jgi:methyl-accepting chemotaxis protein
MRAADAAKNTANLIEGTVIKVKNGSEIVSKTNEAFARVATGAQKVGELVGEISAASNEQAQGIEQINKAVSEMDKVVQKNAANAEESASASEEMSAQAEQMKGFVADLLALVTGNKNGNGHLSVRDNHPIGISRSLMSGIPQNQKTGSIKSLNAFNRQGVGVAAHRKAKEVRPDQVIPLDEGDFKQF